MHRLQQIRPKTLSSNRDAFLEGSACLLDLDTCKVLMPNGISTNYQASKISIKSLFNMELENASAISKNDRPAMYVPDLTWNTIPINLIDVNVFNSIASAGDAIFWHGNLSFNKKSWSLTAAGFVYYIEYSMPKIVEWASEHGISFNIDHNVCYYMNQMFKSVTKTKPRVLKVAFDDDNLYLKEDSDECQYVVIVPRSHPEYNEKLKSFNAITEMYVGLEVAASKSTVDRISYGKDKDSLFKHLTKCLGDTINMYAGGDADFYKSDTVKLWINKKKSQ